MVSSGWHSVFHQEHFIFIKVFSPSLSWLLPMFFLNISESNFWYTAKVIMKSYFIRMRHWKKCKLLLSVNPMLFVVFIFLFLLRRHSFQEWLCTYQIVTCEKHVNSWMGCFQYNCSHSSAVCLLITSFIIDLSHWDSWITQYICSSAHILNSAIKWNAN